MLLNLLPLNIYVFEMHARCLFIKLEKFGPVICLESYPTIRQHMFVALETNWMSLTILRMMVQRSILIMQVLFYPYNTVGYFCHKICVDVLLNEHLILIG